MPAYTVTPMTKPIWHRYDKIIWKHGLNRKFSRYSKPRSGCWFQSDWQWLLTKPRNNLSYSSSHRKPDWAWGTPSPGRKCRNLHDNNYPQQQRSLQSEHLQSCHSSKTETCESVDASKLKSRNSTTPDWPIPKPQVPRLRLGMHIIQMVNMKKVGCVYVKNVSVTELNLNTEPGRALKALWDTVDDRLTYEWFSGPTCELWASIHNVRLLMLTSLK